MAQSPGEPPYGDPGHRSPADPYRDPESYRYDDTYRYDDEAGHRDDRGYRADRGGYRDTARYRDGRYHDSGYRDEPRDYRGDGGYREAGGYGGAGGGYRGSGGYRDYRGDADDYRDQPGGYRDAARGYRDDTGEFRQASRGYRDEPSGYPEEAGRYRGEYDDAGGYRDYRDADGYRDDRAGYGRRGGQGYDDDDAPGEYGRRGYPPEPDDPWYDTAREPGPYPPTRPEPAYGDGGPPPPAAPTGSRSRGRGPLIGLVIGLAVLVAGLTAAGAWLLMRDPDRGGAPDPVTASQEFLQAVYRDLDPAAAAATVCSQSRDEAALSAKINELRAAAEIYVEPTYTWGPPQVVTEEGELAVVEVTLTMATGDERMSSLDLRLTVLDKGSRGWWVCEVATGSDDPTPQPTGTPSPTADGEAEE